jgi:hypothetical protein
MAGLRVLGIVLAGGAGRCLGPLTADRAKSAITFGGLDERMAFPESASSKFPGTGKYLRKPA